MVFAEEKHQQLHHMEKAQQRPRVAGREEHGSLESLDAVRDTEFPTGVGRIRGDKGHFYMNLKMQDALS